MSRLLDNRHIQVRSWYEPIARRLLETVVSHDLPLRLLLDGTKVGNGHQLLMVALAYRRTRHTCGLDVGEKHAWP